MSKIKEEHFLICFGLFFQCVFLCLVVFGVWLCCIFVLF